MLDGYESLDIDQLTDDESYVTVRCPFTRIHKKSGARFTCSWPCAEIIPPGAGRAFCKQCSKKFNYEISTAKRFNVQTMIVAKPVKETT